ncbi:MAG: hypothetical protein SXV54_08825 [Chloroflexota bacterium]|nr:hypothetical protein [Chloroflexota bacterium]
MRNVRSSLKVVVMAVLLVSSVSAIYPQQPPGDCDYFAETGHYVCGEFLEFYKTQGGLEIFGFPLTEEFDDPTYGMKVQYFQNARMELHPNNPAPYRVQLGLLVDELKYTFPPASPEQIPAFNSNLHHYFPETGHVVSYAFLEYFRDKGGLDIFGYPRSEFMYESGYIVQYFQRARVEWHPEIVSGPQMRLTPLGETYIEQFGVYGGYDEPRDPPPPRITEDSATATPESGVTRLHVSASVRYVITGREGGQTIFVYVTDQRQEPIQGADVKAVVHYQSGDQLYDRFDPTNASGFTGLHFDILPASPGQKVVIDVTVTYGNLTGTTQTFFLPWW